ncbi:dihydropteroate synthase [Fontisphaera persica]|uniref:dihydropteroate synthase n=1 Tax=Fontisphaera persica TaxID=2974023 RepID=UPI0024C01F6D|nr:dihydropteroate synthase [Fontisphaera persica]WCJ58324.1 dihydropteroate synthase [Fontisphaera persica]
MQWTARQFTITFPRPMLVMGIVNVTPDSFYDGGRYFGVEAAVRHALDLVAEGADILDIGGESTRPGAEPVPEEEERRRVLPVIEALAARVKIPLSIDTVKPAVARAAIGAGASIINDIAANRAEPEMWEVAAATGAGYVAMHMQGTPATMQQHPEYQDVVAEVGRFFEDVLGRLQQAGVRPEQTVLDVGIGFGKTVEHNLQLLAALRQFKRWGRPLLLGVSRKSFIGKLLGAEPPERLPGSLACACWAAMQGVEIIRAHDVRATVHAVRMTEALMARQLA